MSSNLIQNSSFEDDGINLLILYSPVTGWTFSSGAGSANSGETAFYDPALDGHSGYLAIGQKEA